MQMHFFKKKANMSFTQACLDVSIILQSGRELILQTLLFEQWGSGLGFLHIAFPWFWRRFCVAS